MANSATLWMGDLEPYMDEQFLIQAYAEVGERVVNAKLIRNKQTSSLASYCFIEFRDTDTAQRAMLRLNGKPIPGTNPLKRFKLNQASYGKEHLLSPEYSIFVGDLSDEVDDFTLFNAFMRRYKSTKGAKVVLNEQGKTKGFGFVRFGDEVEQQTALREMQRAMIGSKPVRVSMATPKRPNCPPGAGNSSYDWASYYQWNPAWGYGDYYNPSSYGGYYGGPVEAHSYQAAATEYEDPDTPQEPQLVDDFEHYNKEIMANSGELYRAIDSSRWLRQKYVDVASSAAAPTAV